ncbi:hypothetical protein K470DRAFT_264649 [Piedraia hortae CBS 480.64]|uniref:GAT domain-containing protein n=1 Tax=Piedraia hortae CBS 480.64 TaxID=1314780 RepID=A0A6A7BY75_9PEZI|nr:hypothetical protein K470DRAFT_264649 [Piedraia hortae CBS 480.64]
MKRFSNFLNRGQSFDSSQDAPDSPEANASRAIKSFCESSPNGDEVLHLPVIVEAAESSPSAAARAAQLIRRYLADSRAPPRVHYNAIMLIRILGDNPGPTFTRCFDKTFVSTVKELWRSSSNSGTGQILRETLDHIESSRAWDPGPQMLIQMWQREKGKMLAMHPQRQPVIYSPSPPMPQGLPHQPRLPPPEEMASRVEEARNTAAILTQLVESTPAHSLVLTPLPKEFSERCQRAQKDIQGFIGCENPRLDSNTLHTLIDTAEQLNSAESAYQRAMLAARRAKETQNALNPSTATDSMGNTSLNLPPSPAPGPSKLGPSPVLGGTAQRSLVADPAVQSQSVHSQGSPADHGTHESSRHQHQADSQSSGDYRPLELSLTSERQPMPYAPPSQINPYEDPAEPPQSRHLARRTTFELENAYASSNVNLPRR